eukprot:CAMPEP_0206239160 /NCGR_PEP_ID=MMETSP0047_2-20121206/15226_1 /ASSEMBLY_ACC=CAM_ASM_000192 /TAXON_ID=195065 /ORGANISM="Chroomonas mesostigmatica_cf, Strain CCMP1168" /LENGTH=108 /DNA_ID=CAMNT_0053663795 /DNA_START=784 /DNA_END=1110 /DNA_ORIENTATION=-
MLGFSPDERSTSISANAVFRCPARARDEMSSANARCERICGSAPANTLHALIVADLPPSALATCRKEQRMASEMGTSVSRMSCSTLSASATLPFPCSAAREIRSMMVL